MKTLVAIVVAVLISAVSYYLAATILFMVTCRVVAEPSVVAFAMRVFCRGAAAWLAVRAASSWFRSSDPIHVFVGYAIVTVLLFAWTFQVNIIRLRDEAGALTAVWRLAETAFQGVALLVGAFIGMKMSKQRACKLQDDPHERGIS